MKKGDLLVEFDRQGQIKASLDRRAEFLDFEQQIKKQAEHATARAKDEAELKQAENAVEGVFGHAEERDRFQDRRREEPPVP